MQILEVVVGTDRGMLFFGSNNVDLPIIWGNGPVQVAPGVLRLDVGDPDDEIPIRVRVFLDEVAPPGTAALERRATARLVLADNDLHLFNTNMEEEDEIPMRDVPEGVYDCHIYSDSLPASELVISFNALAEDLVSLGLPQGPHGR